MNTTHTAKVIVRHALTCHDRKKGPDWRRCDCRKSLIVYDGVFRNDDGKLTNQVVSAHTRSWSQAEKEAQEWLDRFDPEKVELKQLRAAKERRQVRIEDAVALYTADKISCLGDKGSVEMVRSLLGHVDVETKQVKRPGHLFAWLDKQIPRPVFLADLTPSHLTAWRASWKFNDLTAAQRWGMLRGFFNFCEAQGWIDDSPIRKLKPPKVKKGNRTAIFTDNQYVGILDVISSYDPKTVPAAMLRSWQQRLTTFIELMRWSGMDLVDAVQYTPNLVDNDGVLRYRRQKTGMLATIPLPDRLVVLLRDVPLEHNSVGAEQPFRLKGCTAHSNTETWRYRLERLFSLAGITEVHTDQRTRTPHAKMLRDTFAVWHLRHGANLRTVSKMLGHASTSMTEKAYLPWVKELEDAHIADVRKSLAHLPKPSDGQKVVSIISR